ncbi:MAG: outer membrane lipoprotein LolB [Gammaproteobacteria bacterium]|nr:MAG: outer membrane lipoprotein LolB [Gammaproteobacteria bacterium]
MISYIKKSLGCLLIAVTLTSCTTMAPPPTSVSWQNRQLALNQLQQWQLNGKVGIQTAQNAGSANLSWIEDKQHHYTLSLTGPLGTGGLKLTGQPGLVILETSDGKRYTAQTPEQLIESGWDLPLTPLYYWIRGIPVPDVPSHRQFDTDHRLNTLTQYQAQIQYLSYTHVGQVELPNKIFITSPRVKIKIIIYEWKLL